ncbi:S9 family peptidase [soil metagenome]
MTDPSYLSIDDLLDMTQLADPQIHPDGDRIAYTRSSAVGEKDKQSGTSRIWLTAGTTDDRRIIAGGTHARHPRWSPDGEKLAYLGKLKGSKHHQVCFLECDWGEARVLTNLKAGVSRFAWAPDGRSIVLIAADPEPDEVAERKKKDRDWIEYEEHHRFNRLWRYDFDSGKAARLTDDDIHVYEFAWSPDGKQVAAIAADQPYGWAWYRARLVLIDVESGGVSTLYAPEKQIARPAWRPDGETISVISCVFSDEGMTGGDVVLVDPASGEPRNLTEGHPRSYLECHWSSDGRSIVIPAIEDGAATVCRLDLAGNCQTLWFKRASLATFGGIAMTGSSDGQQIAVITATPDSPPAVQRGRVGDDAIDWSPMTDANDNLASTFTSNISTVHWPSFDDRTIQGLLLRPHHLPPDQGPLPMIVLVHGGPTGISGYDFPNIRSMGWAHLLAERGYLCFFPNYRGSMGFGTEFAELNNRDLGGGDLEDVLLGIDYCIEQGWANADRLGIGGWSYGGYLTPWAITQTPRFKAAVSGASITNWTSFHGVSTIQGFDETFNQTDPYNADGFYTFRSPVYNLDTVQTPTLFLHGEQDPVCPVGQAYEMWRGLKERGVESQLVVYPREHHGFREREHVRDMLSRIVDWFSERV